MGNKGYAELWGANKVYYGRCGNGESAKTDHVALISRGPRATISRSSMDDKYFLEQLAGSYQPRGTLLFM